MFYHLAMVFFSFCAAAAGTFLLPQGVSPLAHGQAGAKQQDGQRAECREDNFGAG